MEVVFEKINEVHFRVHAERPILSELYKRYTFMAPNYRHHPLFKKKLWNGEIHLLKNNQLYLGLMSDAKEFLESEGHEVHIENDFHLEAQTEIDPDLIIEFLDSLGLPWEVRDYQLKGFTLGIKRGRAFLLAAVNAGKSVMAYMYHRYYKTKTLIITPRTNLVNQMARDFESYGYTDPILKIMAGVDRDEASNYNVVVSTYQSLLKVPEEWFQQFGLVIMDEAHHAKAKTLISIMENLVNCRHRFAMTGTTDELEVNEMVLKGLFGDFINVVSMAELIEQGYSADTEINMILLKYPESVRKMLHSTDKNNPIKGLKGKDGFNKEMDFLCSYAHRNRFLKSLISRLEGNTLILFNRREKHGLLLKELLTDTDKPLYYIDGKVDMEDREEYISIIKTETNCNILASYGTFSEGISIDGIDNLVIAAPSNSRIRVLQSMGRSQRRSETKTRCKIFDIGDDLSWKSKKNHTLKYYKNRADMYGREQLSFRTEVADVTSKYGSTIQYS